MFGMLVGLAISIAAAYFGYSQARRFVAGRLRYVDAANSAFMPLLIGGAAALVALPVVGLLPFVGVGTALAFGASVGLGAAAGRGDIRKSLPPEI
jgi:hypothetical protein